MTAIKGDPALPADRGGDRPAAGSATSLYRMMVQETARARERHRRLLAGGARGRSTLAIFFASTLLVLFLILSGTISPAVFIIASFLLFMGYFITLLIPFGATKKSVSRGEISRFFASLREAGVIRSTERFSRIMLDAFLMNCRPLFIGFTAIFCTDILLVIGGAAKGTISEPVAGLVFFQSVAIIAFYFLVWRLEPYSTCFLADVRGVREGLERRRIPRPIVTALLWAGAALALVSVFIVIIMLPGFTVSSVLSIEEIERLGDLVLPIALVLACQYFICRYIHGITSRDLLVRYAERTSQSLTAQSDPLTALSGDDQPPGPAATAPAADAPLAAEVLLASRIFRIDERTIFGAFPVYIVNPDLSVILEQGGLSAAMACTLGTKTG